MLQRQQNKSGTDEAGTADGDEQNAIKEGETKTQNTGAENENEVSTDQETLAEKDVKVEETEEEPLSR